MYKAFVRPHLDYGYVIFGEAYNEIFHRKVESIQYNACQSYRELLEYYQEKNVTMNSSWDPSNVDIETGSFQKPTKLSKYNTSNTHESTLFHTNHNFFKNSVFSSTVIEQNKIDPKRQGAATLSVFKNNLLEFIRPSPNSFLNCHNCKGIKYLTRLCPGLIHFHEHQFKYSF